LKNNWIPHIFLLGAALIYGANYSIAKIVLDGNYISPMGLVLFRALTASVIFISFHSIFIREKIDKKDYKKLLLVALFGVVVNQSFFIIGLKHTIPINAALLLTIVPILVFIFSAILLKEKVNRRKIIGISLGFLGVLIIILNKGGITLSYETLKGDFLVFLNSVSYALYLVKVKPLLKKYHPITVTKWIFIFGLVFLIPFGYNGVSTVNWVSFDNDVWMAFIYVLLFTTVLAYLFNIIALKKVNPTVVGVYVYLQPVLATFFALIMGKDSLTLVKIIAGILIFSGVYLVSIKSLKSSS